MPQITYTLVDLDGFYDHILPEIPGYVRTLVDQEILSVCNDFCMRTRLWRETTTLDVVEGDATYVVTPASTALFMEVRYAEYNGKKLDVFTVEQIDSDPTFEGWRTKTGEPEAVVVVDEDEVLLYPIPNADLASGLVIESIMATAPDATQVPNFLVTRHHDTIAAGVKANLMAMGKKPWTDRDMSQKYAADYEGGVSKAAWRQALGRTRMPARTTVCHKVR